jgi:hypothetical protein
MRNVIIPAREAVSFNEGNYIVEEHPKTDHSPGLVRVETRRCDDTGAFLPGPPKSYAIADDMYDTLMGDGHGWADPGKPIGTYRNEDLWHFIDIIRSMTGDTP